MLDFSSTKTTDSVTYPGERFVTRRVGPVLRASTELKVAKERAKLREIQERFTEIGTKLNHLLKTFPQDPDGKPLIKDSDITPEMIAMSKERDDLDEEYTLYNTANVKPAWIRAGFVSLESKPDLTADQLLESTCDLLIEEIYQTIYSGAYVRPEQAKTSPSSTTSAAAEDGQTNSTTAESAKSLDTTTGETAPDISPAN